MAFPAELTTCGGLLIRRFIVVTKAVYWAINPSQSTGLLLEAWDGTGDTQLWIFGFKFINDKYIVKSQHFKPTTCSFLLQSCQVSRLFFQFLFYIFLIILIYNFSCIYYIVLPVSLFIYFNCQHFIHELTFIYHQFNRYMANIAFVHESVNKI